MRKVARPVPLVGAGLIALGVAWCLHHAFWGNGSGAPVAPDLQSAAVQAALDNGLCQWQLLHPAALAGDEGWFGNMVWDPAARVWRLYYHKDDNTIALRTSQDGRTFADRRTVLAPTGGGGDRWDRDSIGVPFVWHEPGAARPWRMVYRGRGDPRRFHFQVGLATSVDGIAWERADAGGHPLTGPIVGNGKKGDWDDGDLDFGAVIRVDNTYYVYYSTISNPRRIGLATSTDRDLRQWTKDTANPLYGASRAPADRARPSADEDGWFGRFCPDIVRWDAPDGAERYVMYVPHRTNPSPGLCETEVYTCARPAFYPSERVFAGVMLKTNRTPRLQIEGRPITGLDTPRIVTDTIERNVGGTAITGGRAWMVLSMLDGGWRLYLFSREVGPAAPAAVAPPENGLDLRGAMGDRN